MQIGAISQVRAVVLRRERGEEFRCGPEIAHWIWRFFTAPFNGYVPKTLQTNYRAWRKILVTWP